jgi:hypothetical protein
MDLPVRPDEAAELASLIFDAAERKPLTDEVRTRIAARAAGSRVETIQPYFGSLNRDLVHHSTYYLAVDGRNGSPHLLHIAPATAPTSSIFHKPVLIGRMRQFVINAIPFAAADWEALDKFAGQIDKAFLPRPHGSQPAIVAPASAEAFETFRAILKETGRNAASVRGDYHLALWTAIRAGWRHGYSAVVELPADSTREAVRDLAAFSTFVVGGGLEAVERTHTYIREARSALKINRPFELAVALDSSDGLADFLEWLKSRNHAAQIAMLPLAGCSEDAIRGLAEVCRQNQCALGASEELEIVARVTGGRATFWVDEVPRSLLG